jgi:hypothetical protein
MYSRKGPTGPFSIYETPPDCHLIVAVRPGRPDTLRRSLAVTLLVEQQDRRGEQAGDRPEQM